MPSEADSADQGAATPKPTAPVVVRNLVLIPLIGIGLTAWAARGLDFSHIHLHSIINDQFDYVTGARNLLRTGNWERYFIAPSLVAQPYTRNAMYVPGHFAILAAFYAFFGYGVWQSILPNLVSFAIAPLLIYLTGIRLWNHRIAWLAVLIFWANPFHRLFALTAMSESTFVAATALSLCIFVYLRDAWKALARSTVSRSTVLMPGIRGGYRIAVRGSCVCSVAAALARLPDPDGSFHSGFGGYFQIAVGCGPAFVHGVELRPIRRRPLSQRARRAKPPSDRNHDLLLAEPTRQDLPDGRPGCDPRFYRTFSAKRPGR